MAYARWRTSASSRPNVSTVLVTSRVFFPVSTGFPSAWRAAGAKHRATCSLAPASMVLARGSPHVPGGAYSRRPPAYISPGLRGYDSRRGGRSAPQGVVLATRRWSPAPRPERCVAEADGRFVLNPSRSQMPKRLRCRTASSRLAGQAKSMEPPAIQRATPATSYASMPGAAPTREK